MKAIQLNSGKILLILIISIGISCPVYSQAIIHRNYDALQGLSGYSMSRFDNGDIAHIGSVRFYLGSNVSIDPMFMKTDSLGNVKWALRYNMSREDDFIKAVLLPDQSLVALGSTKSFGPYGINNYFDTLRYNILIAKIDSSGIPLQVVVYGDTLQDMGTDLIYSNSGDMIMLAMSNFDHTLDVKRGNLLLTRIDTSLNITTSKEFYFGTGVKVLPNRIVESNGYFYVSGIISFTDTVVNWSDAFLIKLDQNFDIQWSIRMGSDENYFHTRILPHPDNGVFIGFNTTDYGTGSWLSDFVVAYIDSLGSVLWANRYGNIGDDRVNHLMFDSDTNNIVIAAGIKYFKIDFSGNMLWSKRFPLGQITSAFTGLTSNSNGISFNCLNQGTSDQSLDFVIADSTGINCTGSNFIIPNVTVSVIVASIQVSDLSYNASIDTPGINPMNLSIIVSNICETATALNDESSIDSTLNYQIYPNPVCNSLYLKHDDDDVLNISELQVFDNTGAIVFHVKSCEFPIDLSSLPSGIYLIRYLINHVYFTQRFIKS